MECASAVSVRAFERGPSPPLGWGEVGIARPDTVEERIISHILLDKGDLVVCQAQRSSDESIDLIHVLPHFRLDAHGVELIKKSPQFASRRLSRAERNQTKGRSKILPPRPWG